MDADEKLRSVPKLREEGNRLFADKKYELAAEMYGEALAILEQLALRLVGRVGLLDIGRRLTVARQLVELDQLVGLICSVRPTSVVSWIAFWQN